MSSETTSSLAVAWISRGRLYVKRGERPVQEIESRFAQDAMERELRHAQENSWKGRSGIWGGLGMEPPGMVPWQQADPRRHIRIVTAARGNSADEIYYVLDMGAVGGLFSYDLQQESETRLMHQQGFTAQDLSRHPEDGRLVVSLMRNDGTMGLSVTRHDGLYGRRVTLSDSIDEAPAWMPDESQKIVFQSSAIGRDENGYAVGKSTYRLEQLDLESEEVTQLYEEDGVDLLQPRPLADGSVLFIRRPYRAESRPQASLLEVAQDVVLFPYRLLRTFVHLAHFLSMSVSGKPLINAGGPDRSQPTRSQKPFLMMYGQAVDLRQAMASGTFRKDESHPLVSEDWQLVKHEADGQQTVLGTNVLAFDVSSQGEIVCTDGRRIYQLRPDGTRTTVADGDIIEKVVVLN